MKVPLDELDRLKYFLLAALFFAALGFEYVRYVLPLEGGILILMSMVFYGVMVVSIVLWTFSRIKKQRRELERQREKLMEYSDTMTKLVEKKTAEVRMLAEIAESSADAIISMDLEGRVTSWNRGAEEIFGYTKEEIMGEKFMLLGPREVVAEAKECFAKVLRKGRVKNEECLRQHKDGRLVPVNLTATLLRDPSGRAVGVSAVMKDLTEIKKAEQLLLRTQKLAAVGKLAAGLAHEINNPLGNISLYADMLLKKAKGRDREKLKVIKEQATLASKCLKDLLELSRPVDVEHTRVSLGEVLYKAVEALKPRMEKAKIQLIQDLDDGATVTGNAMQLQQAFANLLLNAVQAMPRGGQLRVALRKRRKTVKVIISDTGPGIPEEELDKIFDPFYTTKGLGKGTGLGLFITHMIISGHDGRIEVESEPGRGSTFIVDLPAGGSNEG